MTKRISIIEIDLPKCANDYGQAPCTAAVGVTGEQKCFNCLNTCQDTPNYSATTETVRYSKPSTNIPENFPMTVGNIEAISYSAPVLKLGESLGTRASISVTFADHPSPDTDASGDKYQSERGYNPFNQGSYFGKFKARYPFLQGSTLRWIQGTSDQALADMETRTFVIEAMKGPSASGRFSITAKDILKLADNDRAVAPFTLEVQTTTPDINETFTGSLEISLPDPNSIPATGYAVLSGSEIITYSVVGLSLGGTNIQVLTRGELDTEASSHDIGSTFQDVLTYSGEKASAIFYDLLTTYAGIPTSYIDLDDWTAEDDVYINRLYGSNIATPTGVAKLINELLEQTASSMWWDNQSQLIRWSVLKNQAGAGVYDESKYISGSFNVTDDNTRRVSRCYVRFGQRNPLLNLDEPSNFAATALRLELESERFFDDKPSYKTISSRWITGSARDTAERLGDLILQRYSLPPRKVGFKLLRDSGVAIPELAGAYNLEAQTLQNADGSRATKPIQITSLSPDAATYTVMGEEITFNGIIAPDDPDTVNITVPATTTAGFDIREEYDKQAPTPTDDTIVNVTVPTGVIVGSGSVGSYAFLTGTWPTGAIINIVNRGHIVGRGGSGGNGANIKAVEGFEGTYSLTIQSQATSGQNGGPAIQLQHPVSIDNQGVIGGGGGGAGGNGGGAGSAQVRNGAVALIDGSGGGGGAGYIAGSGGATDGEKIGAGVSPINGFAGGLETTVNVNNGANATGSGVGTASVVSPDSGAGGNLGQAGANGSNASASSSGIKIESNGASGGSAGAAIDTNGNAITWVNMGTVSGAIN